MRSYNVLSKHLFPHNCWLFRADIYIASNIQSNVFCVFCLLLQRRRYWNLLIITDGGRVSLPEAAIAKIKVLLYQRGWAGTSQKVIIGWWKSRQENDADIYWNLIIREMKLVREKRERKVSDWMFVLRLIRSDTHVTEALFFRVFSSGSSICCWTH